MEKQVLNLQSALELLDNDRDLLKILMESFINDMPFDTEKLDKMISSKNYDEAAKYVHAVKGAGRQLCAERLALAGQELEDVLRHKKEGDTTALASKMKDEYTSALNEIKEQHKKLS